MSSSLLGVLAVVVPVVAALIAGLVAWLTARGQVAAQTERLRTELKTEFMAEEAIRQLLTVTGWELRSFTAIGDRIGGFTDDELRRLLVRSGAVRFTAKDGREMWGLRDRNARELGRQES